MNVRREPHAPSENDPLTSLRLQLFYRFDWQAPGSVRKASAARSINSCTQSFIP